MPHKGLLASAALIIPLLISKKTDKSVGLVNSSSFSHQKQKSTCPKNCFCAHSTVICKGIRLDNVPKNIPNDTTKLDLQGNRITKLNAEDFAGLSDLRDNLIQEIEDGVFTQLKALERLRLDKNRIRSLPSNGFLTFNKLLRRLQPLQIILFSPDLSQNELWTISTEQIIGPTELLTLNLDRNQLHCLDSLSLNQWPSLEQLTISSNALTSLSELDLASLPKLRILKLGDNPWNCDCRMRWLKRLKVASQIRCYRPSYLFSRTLDKVSLKQLKCSGLEKRGITGSKRTCRQMDGCPSVCTCTQVGGNNSNNLNNGNEIVVDCHDRNLRFIPSGLPQNTVELRLEQNKITKLEANTFSHMSKLIRLDISKNNIIDVHPEAFKGLKQLNSLMLFANNLTDLDHHVFQDLESLQVLLLNGNKLKCLRDGIFNGLKHLRLLSLYDNNLKSITETTFSPLKNSLQILHLAKNPLICDCNLKWLAKLLYSRPIETSGARCNSPERLEKHRIITTSIVDFKCLGSEELITLGAGNCILDNECPEFCKCFGTIVDCSNVGLLSPPSSIPHFTTSLILSNNKITKLEPFAFGTLPNLQSLDLSENNLSYLAPNSLNGITNLEILNLSNNSLFQLNILKALNDGNEVDLMTKKDYKLEITFLDGNAFTCLSLESFPDTLKKLTLNRNQNLHAILITNDKTKLSLNIEIDGSGQWLCNCNLNKLLRNGSIKIQKTLSIPPKCVGPDNFKGMPLEEFKNIICKDQQTNSYCSEEGILCPFGCKCITTNYNEEQKQLIFHKFKHRRRRLLFRHRRHENKNKFNSVILNCSNSSLINIPWPLPYNTEELILDNNRIEFIKFENFNGLKQLRKLDISHNLIENIPSNVFSSLKKLNSLLLSNNRIRCLSEGAFDGLEQLRVLSLQSNLISYLPESAFSKFVIETQQTLSHISLGDNPLLCDCGMNWAIKWLKSKFLEPGIARCSAPPERRQQLLLSVQPYAPCPPLHNKKQADLCNLCSPEKCLNGGKCLLDENTGEKDFFQFKCICASGFYGNLCENRIDACFGVPCRNGGKCLVKFGENKLLYEGRFKCICLRGFTGERCERKVNECIEKGGKERCLNGGKCLEQLNGFKCECQKGWIGNFCEINVCGESLQNNCSLIRDEELSILSRIERANSNGNKLTKRNFCSFNFADPPKCNRRRAIAIKTSNSFISLGYWPINNNYNFTGNIEISFHFATNQSEGTMFWLAGKNDESFMILELIRGRLRLALQLGKGHEPYSQLYSMNIVNDAKSHWLVISLNGKKLYLTVDDFPTQFAINTGPLNYFPDDFVQIYFGGVPADLGRRGLVHFRIFDSSSVIGCFWDIRLNQTSENEFNLLPYQSLDLSKYININDTSIGECFTKLCNLINKKY
ncbi:hypothetical protein Mgra_00006342, partial [Meloidogyne graminicola]